jgi:hypothetical protein
MPVHKESGNQGPVLLELLDSLEVKISLSLKELDFKPFMWTAGFHHLCVVGRSCHTPASRSFPNSTKSLFLFAPIV